MSKSKSTEIKYAMVRPDVDGDRETNKGGIRSEDQFTMTFGEFYEQLKSLKMVTDNKHNAPYIYPLTFRDDDDVGRMEWNGQDDCIRKKWMYGEDYTMIVADHDGGMTIEEAEQRYSEYAYVLHTSFSHNSPDGKGDIGPRFRMYFPLKRHMAVEEHHERRDAIFTDFLDTARVDNSNSSRARGYVAPVARKGYEDEFYMTYNDGKLLDALAFKRDQKIIDREKKISKQVGKVFSPSTQADKVKLAEMIFYIFEDGVEYDPWYKFINSMVAAEFDENWIKNLSDGSYGSIEFINNSLQNIDPDDRAIGSLIRLVQENGYPEFSLNNTSVNVVDTVLEDMVAKSKANKAARVAADVDIDDDDDEEEEESPIVKYTHEHCAPIELHDGETFIKSPKGTGKTYQLKSLVEKARAKGLSVLNIGHRISLLADQSTRIGLDNYKDSTGTDLQSSDELAICINSLRRIEERVIFGKGYDIVLIDECEQVIRTLAQKKGTIHSKDRAMIARLFYRIIKCAKQVVCLDADLGMITVETLMMIRGEVDIDDSMVLPNMIFQENEYKVSGKCIDVYENQVNIENHINRCVKSGDSVFVTTNSKNWVMAFSTHLRDRGIRHTAIHGDNSDTIEILDYIKYLGSLSEGEKFEGEIVLATPSIGTGVDIQGSFDHVIGIFNFNNITHSDFDQQMARVRHGGEYSAFVTKRQCSDCVDVDVIRDLLARNAALVEELCSDIPKKDSSWYEFLKEIHVKVVAADNLAKNYVFGNYVRMKRDQGWKVNYLGKSRRIGKSVYPQQKRRADRTTLII